MAYTRADIITEVRDAFYEDSERFFSDVKLRRFLTQEIRTLPRRNIYLEEIWTVTTTTDLSYSLPTNTHKIEELQINTGSVDSPNWSPVTGWDMYGGALYLETSLSAGYTLRALIKKKFAPPTDDVTAVDIPDEKMEVVVWGTVLRAYRAFLGYLKDASNWDAIANPRGISYNQVLNWYMEAKKEYKDLVQLYRTVPRPRNIDLVS